MNKIVVNVSNGLAKSCPVESGGIIKDCTYFVDFLKTLDFNSVVKELKKKEQTRKAFLKLSFNDEMALKRALKNNTGRVEFYPRRGYTAVTLIF